METSATDRLTILFGKRQLPRRPTGNEQTFAERELADLNEKAAKWSIPNTAKYPRKIQGRTPQIASGGNVDSDSDDDDGYSAAFQTTTISTKSKRRSHHQAPRVMPEPNAFGYDISQVPKKETIACIGNFDGSNEIDPHEDVLPRIDDHGNGATGHFCQLSLVTKFPYKYMADGNDRVSRRFFAGQRIWERTWDL
jgi:hypothetical protein